jgi:hypothetical protein
MSHALTGDGAERCGESLKLRGGVYRAISQDGETYLMSPPRGLPLGCPGPGAQRTLELLAGAVVPDHELLRRASAGEAAEIRALLMLLRDGGWATATVTYDAARRSTRSTQCPWAGRSRRASLPLTHKARQVTAAAIAP